MLAMRGPDRGDRFTVARSRQPVMDQTPDAPPPWTSGTRPLPFGPIAPGNQQDNPLTGADRALEKAIDRVPGLIETHSMKVERAIGKDLARSNATFPVTIQIAVPESTSLHQRSLRHRAFAARSHCNVVVLPGIFLRSAAGIAKRANGRSDLLPQRAFVRVELAHGRPRPWGAGSGPGQMPTSSRPEPPPRRPRPRKYRTGSAP